MHFNALAVAALSAVASAKTIRVNVGSDGLNFTPSDIQADVGDVLDFNFYPRNHSVVAADFTNPCHPKADGGFSSDFVPTPSGVNPNVFQVTVNDTRPIWFYCSQPVFTHCQSGMVGSVNAASSGNRTLAQFKAAAATASTSTTPVGVFGGVFSTGNGTSANSTGGSGSPTSSSTPVHTGGAAGLSSMSALVLGGVAAAIAFAA